VGTVICFPGKYWPAIGSPPRVWGQSPWSAPRWSSSRFTPTRVGTVIPRAASISANKVHPHACGDSLSHVPDTIPHRGSPPRVWGQLPYDSVITSGDRFTPTRVGTVSAWPREDSYHTVHPHACGDSLSSRKLSFLYKVHPHACGDSFCNHNTKFYAHRFTPTRVGTVRFPLYAFKCI